MTNEQRTRNNERGAAVRKQIGAGVGSLAEQFKAWPAAAGWPFLSRSIYISGFMLTCAWFITAPE